MKTKFILMGIYFQVMVCIPGLLMAAENITNFDSTQPRGFGGPQDQFDPNACSHGPVYNDQGQNLCPIEDGLWSPQFHASVGGQEGEFEEWKGMMMGNAARDPAFFATLSVANQDFINLLNATATACYPDYLAAQAPAGTVCADVQMALYKILVDPNGTGYLTPVFVLQYLGLDQDIMVADDGTLYPENLLPVTADLCLRCHFTAGWLEGRSEPQSNAFPYLKGQFWGSKFIEYPGWPGAPQPVDIHNDSEADMEGIQCGFCHRAKDNYKRYSNYDGSMMANGSGGYFVSRYDPFEDGEAEPEFDFQEEGVFCGTCHDVTNPLVYTKTPVSPTEMLHPIERTYTEWYWSSYRKDDKCQDCHEPMEFQGAQTWMIYPGLDRLWGAVDKVWLYPPYNYDTYDEDEGVTPYRTRAYMDARMRSEELMREAARLQIVSATTANGYASVDVKITNLTGHKLPTGFAEGRQMWLHITAKDANGNVIFEDGVIENGELARTEHTKVYEQIPLAKGYDPFNLNGYNILDNTTGNPEDGTLVYAPDGIVSHFDTEFHFVLMNYVEKDNRIPPMGFNRAAYMADGAFIVPYDAKDTDYPSGQYWDVTNYTFPLNGYTGKIYVTAKLKYQTFNKLYIDFLANMDREPTEYFGGRARNIPCSDRNQYDGSNEFCYYETWGAVLEDIWTEANYGQPVMMAKANATIGDGYMPPPRGCYSYDDEDSCEDSRYDCEWDEDDEICKSD